MASLTCEQWIGHLNAAKAAHVASVRSYAESRGGEFFDYWAWARGKAAALNAQAERTDRWRRAQGDAQIISHLACCPLFTRRERRAVKAVLKTCSLSGALYASAKAIARAAWVSERTAHVARQKMEDAGMLRRIRTGGKDACGKTYSNAYIVCYGRLRAVLGVPERYMPRSDRGILESARRICSAFYGDGSRPRFEKIVPSARLQSNRTMNTKKVLKDRSLPQKPSPEPREKQPKSPIEAIQAQNIPAKVKDSLMKAYLAFSERNDPGEQPAPCAGCGDTGETAWEAHGAN